MAKNPFSTGFSRLGTRPAAAAGLGIAMVGVPLLAKNDDRGYVSTASVTTPLLGGVALGAQEIYDAARANGGKVWTSIKRGKNLLGNTPVNVPVRPGRSSKDIISK